jgi:hypothetical protein
MGTRITYGNAPELARLFLTTHKPTETFGCFTSPESMTSEIENHKGGFWHESFRKDSDSWSGTKTWAEAIDLCRNGWRDGIEKIAKLREKITAANPIAPRLVRWDVAGAFPSVPRALAGNPLNMRRIDSAQSRRRPILNLITDIAASSSVSADHITRRAACTAAIVDAAEAAGFQCAVITYHRADSHCGKLGAAIVTTVKEPGQPVDLARLAYGLGHAGMLRRHGFAAWGMQPACAPLESVLGRPSALTADLIDQDSGTYIIPGFGRGQTPQVAHFATDDATATKGMAWLVQSLASQGCPAFPQMEAA